jgi:hypothetical protein
MNAVTPAVNSKTLSTYITCDVAKKYKSDAAHMNIVDTFIAVDYSILNLDRRGPTAN